MAKVGCMRPFPAAGGAGISRRRFLQTTSAASLALLGPVSISQAQHSPTLRRRVANVNTTDIGDAVRLACQTMGNVFNEQDHDIPFFASWVTPEIGLAFNPDHSEAHVPGRHLNALLHAEAAFGVKIPGEVIAKHERAAFFSYSGGLPLPLNRKELKEEKPTRFLPHNLREGFHALYALTRYRKSARARELAEQSIRTILDLWSSEHGWNRAKIESKGVQLIEWNGSFITGIARTLGPLVKFYQATKYGPALELALTLKSKALRECFLPDGSYDMNRFGTHTHSTTCTMSSLAHLAELTNDGNLFDRVRLFFDNGLRSISDDIGWSIENTHPNAAPDRGEVNNSGDILETALILGRHGYPQYFHFAERAIRCHILPSQLRDISFIKENKPADGKLSLAQRHVGAFGFPAPYGHAPLEGPREISFNMDIVGGATDSLCYAQQSISQYTDSAHRVHLLFAHETEAIKTTSPYPNGRMQITLKKPGSLFVRVPPWVNRESLKTTVGERPRSVRLSNNYLWIEEAPVHTPIELAWPLSSSEITLKHRTRDIRVRLMGDSVSAMQNFNADLTFFDELT